MESLGALLVHGVHKLKKTLGCHTYNIEMIAVAAILIAAALISKKGWIERVGVLAVFLTF